MPGRANRKESDTVTTYLVRQTDAEARIVAGADTYAPEGTLTTFFATRDGRGVIDSWATRIASFRTAGIASIERVAAPGSTQGTNSPNSASVQNATESAPPSAYTAEVSCSRPARTTAAAIANGNALVA